MSEKCSKHPDKDALSFCHACGKYYCPSCLQEGAAYYYCYDEKCQAAKTDHERSMSEKLAQISKEELPSGKYKRILLKDICYYLCIAFPLYLAAFSLIADFQFQSLGFLLFISLATCVQVVIVISFIVFTFKTFKTPDRKKRLRQISLAMSFIGFIVLFINMEKIKGMDIAEKPLIILSFCASIITFALYSIITMKGHQQAKSSTHGSPTATENNDK
jgi:uncharacterized membrane protein